MAHLETSDEALLDYLNKALPGLEAVLRHNDRSLLYTLDARAMIPIVHRDQITDQRIWSFPIPEHGLSEWIERFIRDVRKQVIQAYGLKPQMEEEIVREVNKRIDAARARAREDGLIEGHATAIREFAKAFQEATRADQSQQG